MYVMHCIRPNIAYVVEQLSRYISNSRIIHWKTLVCVLDI